MTDLTQAQSQAREARKLATAAVKYGNVKALPGRKKPTPKYSELARALKESADRIDRLLALVEQARLRTPGRWCDVCFTSSWSPCPEGTPGALPDPDRKGEWIVCDMCQVLALVGEQR